MKLTCSQVICMWLDQCVLCSNALYKKQLGPWDLHSGTFDKKAIRHIEDSHANAPNLSTKIYETMKRSQTQSDPWNLCLLHRMRNSDEAHGI